LVPHHLCDGAAIDAATVQALGLGLAVGNDLIRLLLIGVVDLASTLTETTKVAVDPAVTAAFEAYIVFLCWRGVGAIRPV
jgi:hypothetical protein